MEWAPADNFDVLYVALPPLKVPVPSVVLPSLNVTVPVAAEGVTAAVRVTVEPYVDGLAEDETVTEVLVFPKTAPVKAIKLRIRRGRLIRIKGLDLYLRVRSSEAERRTWSTYPTTRTRT